MVDAIKIRVAPIKIIRIDKALKRYGPINFLPQPVLFTKANTLTFEAGLDFFFEEISLLLPFL